MNAEENSGKAMDQVLLGVYKRNLSDAEIEYPTTNEDVPNNKIGRNSEDLKFIGGVQGGAICKFKSNNRNTANFFEVDGSKDCVWNIDDAQAWHKVKVTFDYDNKMVATNVDGSDLGTAYPMSGLGIEDGIYALSFGNTQGGGMWQTDVYLDNVTVKHIVDRGGAKVSNVRFVDGKGNKYGLSNSVPTLAEKIEINFMSAVDVASLNGSIALTDSSGNSIALNNGGYDEKTNTYTVSLTKLMNKNTQYTLSSSNITSGGKDIDDYSTTFNTDANGAFEVSQLYIKKNGAVVEKGEFAVGDVITVGIKALNSTGVDEYVTFVYSAYNGDRMIKCGLDEATVGAEKTIYTKEFTFTVDSELAANMTDIRGFAWGDIGSVIPLTEFVSLEK